jgi:hypothetical protein
MGKGSLSRLNKAQLLDIAINDLDDNTLSNQNTKTEIIQRIKYLQKYTKTAGNSMSDTVNQETMKYIETIKYQKSEKTNYISGIHRLDYWINPSLNKKNYLLYDTHDNTGVCFG